MHKINPKAYNIFNKIQTLLYNYFLFININNLFLTHKSNSNWLPMI